MKGQLHGFLLKLLDYAYKNVPPNNSKSDCTLNLQDVVLTKDLHKLCYHYVVLAILDFDL